MMFWTILSWVIAASLGWWMAAYIDRKWLHIASPNLGYAWACPRCEFLVKSNVASATLELADIHCRASHPELSS